LNTQSSLDPLFNLALLGLLSFVLDIRLRVLGSSRNLIVGGDLEVLLLLLVFT